MVPFIGGRGADLGDRADHRDSFGGAGIQRPNESLAALLMVGLLVATLQALRHGDAASLWRCISV